MESDIMLMKDNLKKIRMDANLSQTQLSQKLGIPQYTISDYENGRTEPSIAALCKYAKYFGITVDEVIGIKRMKKNISEDRAMKRIRNVLRRVPRSQIQKIVQTIERLVKDFAIIERDKEEEED